MDFTLVIPGLSWLSKDENISQILKQTQLNNLKRILKYAQLDADTAYQTVSELYQNFLPSYNEIDFFTKNNNLPKNKALLLASPVNLQVHLSHLSLDFPSLLDIRDEEAQALCHDLNIFLKEEQWQFTPTTPQLWVLDPSNLLDFESSHPHDLEVDNLLNSEMTGKDVPKVQRIITEIQTFLFSHAINKNREKEHKTPINSLWLYNPLPSSKLSMNEIEKTQFYTDQPIWQTQFNTEQLPTNFALWLENLVPTRSNNQQHTLLLESLMIPSQYQNYYLYKDTLQLLEKNYFSSLWSAVKSGKIKELTIACHGENGGKIHLTRKDTLKFWKKDQNFNGYLK